MSLSKKTIKWLSKHANVSLVGKTVLITGANSGVGFKTAGTCAYLGANIIMACRNRQKAEIAKDVLASEYPQSTISVLELDLADFSSIVAFVDRIVKEKINIDVLVNNAGVYHQPNKITKDGFELVLGTNYFGTYYLTNKIMPYLLTLPHEVIYINTISLIHKFARKINYNDFYFTKKYRNMSVYARSKLCIAKFTYEMAQRYKNSNVKFFMNHPGIALTPLGLNSVSPKVAKLSRVFGWLFNSPEKSSLSVAYVLSNSFPVGSIIGPKNLLGGFGYPKLNHVARRVKTGADELIVFTEREIKERENL